MLILLPLAPPLHLPCLALHLLMLLTLLFPSVKLPRNGANRLLLLSNLEVPLVLIFFLHLLSLLLVPSSTLQFASSHFPSPWKCASIRPLHKGGDCSIPSNYRPISLLPVPSKLLEKHVHHQLSCHLRLPSLSLNPNSSPPLPGQVVQGSRLQAV